MKMYTHIKRTIDYQCEIGWMGKNPPVITTQIGKSIKIKMFGLFWVTHKKYVLWT